MSLFHAREWWSKKLDAPEECDKGCLCVANIDNDPKNTDKIIVGTYAGMLRIYYPRSSGYKVDDLMYESNFDEPILQIEAGRFIPSSSRIALAVLLPRKLIVYTVTAVASSKDRGADAQYFDLTKAYEHKLDRTAYNFCYGSFGGVYGKDFLCVQSIDGQLSFFEQDSFAFSRSLSSSSSSNFLLPGPLCYVQKIDSFITATSSMEVECYKYQILGAAASDEKKAALSMSEEEIKKREQEKELHGIVSNKKIQVDWSLNIGEHVLQIYTARYSKSLAASQIDIVVVGENTLFTLKENGTIRLQKRLDYNPSTSITYNISEEDVGGSNQNLIIGTHQSSMMVYRDMQLIWAARANYVAVDLKVATFGGIKGFVVMLNEEGEVSLTYMGTDPPITGVGGGAEGKELDYEAMDEEHRKLLKVIRQASNDQLTEPKERLNLRAQVSPTLLHGSEYDSAGFDDSDLFVKNDQGQYIAASVRLFLSYNGKEDLENININISHAAAFHIKERSIVIPMIKGNTNTPMIIHLYFRVMKEVLPTSMSVDVVASFITNKQEPRTSRCEFYLPLVLACRAVAPLKHDQYMFTLETNRSPPSLQQLFPDILEPAIASNPDIARTAANVLSVIFHGTGLDVTILVAKKTGRFRLQSGVFEALSLVSEELVERLYNLFGQKEITDDDGKNNNNNDKEPPFNIAFTELLPLHDYFQLIDKHFNEREKLSELRNKLERSSHQYRVIEKRLLTRFKDKNPTPLNNLDILLNDTYKKIDQYAMEIESSQRSLSNTSNQLSCATQLMLLLIRFKYDLDKKNFDLLRLYLTPVIEDNLSQGWEEKVDASMTHLLRTSLAKNARETAAPTQPLDILKETSKLKKHIQIVCDRLGKGLRLWKKQEKSDSNNNNKDNKGKNEKKSSSVDNSTILSPSQGNSSSSSSSVIKSSNGASISAISSSPPDIDGAIQEGDEPDS